MSVRLDDELFDESPGVVCVVLSAAIEQAGWHLMHVSETGDHLVWEVFDGGERLEVLEALIEPYGEGARVSVRTVRDTRAGAHGGGLGQGGLAPGHTAPVIDLHSRIQGVRGLGPTEPPPFGPDTA